MDCMKTKPALVPPDLSQALIDRFWRYVDSSGGVDSCWPWTGGLNRKGRGLFNCHRGGRDTSVAANRFALYVSSGDWPGALYVLHDCDNPACCNPRHLRTGDQFDNMADMFNRGRAASRVGKNNGRAKLTDEDVVLIRQRHRSGESLTRIAVDYGVTIATCRFVVIGETWKHIPMEAVQ